HRLRLAALALGFALLAGCAGSPQRAQPPAGEPVAAHAATAGEVASSAAAHDPGDGTIAGDASAAQAIDSDARADGAPADGSDGAAAAGADPTQAELDFAAIYGGGVYDPVADPTLPEPAQVGTPGHDPWENWNRKVHGFNMAVDRAVAEPLAR